MAELAVRKPVTKKVAEELVQVAMLFKRAKETKTWWCETDKGLVFADSRLNTEELQNAIDEKDISFNADENGEPILDEDGKMTYFVGYGVKDETCEIIAKTFSARAGKRTERAIAKISKIYEEYELELE